MTHFENEPQLQITITQLSDENVTTNDSKNQMSLDNDDVFSSRVNLITEETNMTKSSRHVVHLTARGYPQYKHYTFRKPTETFPKKFALLPSITGNNAGEQKGISESQMNKADINVHTTKDLRKLILSYGGLETNEAYMKFVKSKVNAKKLVRPGFSARRYLANIIGHMNSDLVQKMIKNGHVLEKTLYQKSILMPHLQRRISDDLSRYPEPYRILKQMLISPGPLNEFSFMWRLRQGDQDWPNKDDTLGRGVIKIVTIKPRVSFEGDSPDGDLATDLEEVDYKKLSVDKKKTVISNLLVKSAMHHAVKVKELTLERNQKEPSQKQANRSKEAEVNIPYTKFDMMSAVKNLLDQETVTNLAPYQYQFRGNALRADKGVAVYDGENLVTDFTHFPSTPASNFEPVAPLPNLKLKLNVSKNSNYWNQKLPRVGSKREDGRVSKMSDSTSKSVFGDYDSLGLPEKDPNSRGQMFADHVKRKAAGKNKSVKPYGIYKDEFEDDYSKFIDTDRNDVSIGDIDPTVSFSNWRYNPTSSSALSGDVDSHHHIQQQKQICETTDEQKQMRKRRGKHETVDFSLQPTDRQSFNPDEDNAGGDNTLSPEDQHRLVELISDQAAAVAEAVLNMEKGGQDFAQDINEAVLRWNNILMERYFELFNYMAIRQVMMQQHPDTADVQPVWSLDVENMQNPEQYEGMIKNIFKSVFRDQLKDEMNDNIQMSEEILYLLQSGSKLSLDEIVVSEDPVTGKKTVTLKDNKLAAVKNEIKNGSKISMSNSFKDGGVVSTNQQSVSQLSETQGKTSTESHGNISSSTDYYYPIGEEGKESQLATADLADKQTINMGNNITRDNTLNKTSPGSQLGKISKDGSSVTAAKKMSPETKKEFKIARVDDSTDIKNLYSQPLTKTKQSTKKKQPKSTVTKTDTKKPTQKSTAKGKSVVNKNKSSKIETETELELELEPDAGNKPSSKEKIISEREDSDPIIKTADSDTLSQMHLSESGTDIKENIDIVCEDEEEIIDDEMDTDDAANQERKLLLRQEREAKRRAAAEKRKLEVEQRRKKRDEERRMEIKKREMEEEMLRQMEEERIKKEEEFRLKREQKKAQELAEMEEEKRREYLRQKQIDRERREKEEFQRKLEEMKAKQALEEQKRKEEEARLAAEEAERKRIEEEMLSRMKEEERLEYLRKKAEEEERQKQEEEEKRRQLEEEARLALEEAQRLAQQQAKERAILEARLRFTRDLRVESEGLKRYLNITPAFVWSYFEFLRILGVQPSAEFGLPPRIADEATINTDNTQTK